MDNLVCDYDLPRSIHNLDYAFIEIRKYGLIFIGGASLRNSHLIGSLAVTALLFQPWSAQAITKKDFQAQAKSDAASLRAKGEPADRCMLGIGVLPGLFISYVGKSSTLAPGDRLLSLKNIDMAGKGPDDVIEILRASGPSETIPATVNREGATLSVNLQCGNGRAAMTAALTALDYAAQGKFDECASVAGLEMPFVRFNCAIFARNKAQLNLPSIAYDALKLQVAAARYLPSERGNAIQSLRANEYIFEQGYSSNLFNDLVKTTRSWPGGENMYDQFTPDWDNLRRNGEAAISARLIDPSSAQFDWPYGFMYGTWKAFLGPKVEGYITCGLVNARNRMGGYVGRTAFVVVLNQAGGVLFSDMGTGKDFDIVSSQCANTKSQLPPPQYSARSEASSSTNDTAPSGAPSLADELKKLTDLKSSGALTEQEFQAAKQKLLGTSPR